MSNAKYRPDQDGTHRAQYDKNKRKILAVSEVCGICGRPLHPELKWPHPLSTTVDHIIPIHKGGHPSAMSNLQATHWACNRAKADKLMMNDAETGETKEVISNRLLPHSRDWTQIK